ncbi:MAG: acyltransferase [Comamonadaceae bacterium PBBC1]|nr:MAG: acyltransferase [Comamonadaceae bacterium PBBC1]
MTYRREIDGLRALAVLPVILFHAGVDAFSGGFVGVDVFFVISGYLITGIIISELAKGNFSLINFYERRARRILPALFLVMLVCLPFSWFLLLPHDLKDFSDSLLAVPLYISNILFWTESGYFDTTAELKPLLHTWSLAVEEQYYLCFPLFLMSIWRFGLRWVLLLMGGMVIAGLAYAEWASLAKPAVAFYLLPSRSWELLLGGLAAFYVLSEHYQAKSHFLSEIASALGMCCVLFSVFYFSKATPFPGFYALIPTVGAVLIILYGTHDTIVGQLLGQKLIVNMGLVSYSAYLWHQPLFAFARHQSINNPDQYILLILSALSIGLAYLSWRFIETPFRNKTWISRKKLFLFVLMGSLFFMGLGLAGIAYKGFKTRFNYPEKFEAQFKLQDHRKNCDNGQGHQSGDVPFCTYGSENNSKPNMVIFGDSHSAAIHPVFEKLAHEQGFTFAHHGLGGCIPLINVDVLKGNWDRGVCKKVSESQYEYVKKNKIKTVILVARWSYYTQGEYEKDMKGYFLSSDSLDDIGREKSRSVFKNEFLRTVESYEKLGAQVIVLLQVPQQKSEPRKIYSKILMLNEPDNKKTQDAILDYSVMESDHLKLQAFNREFFYSIQQRSRLTFVNPDAAYCHDGRCALGTSEYSFYQDLDHLNALGALELEGLLRGALRKAGVVEH